LVLPGLDDTSNFADVQKFIAHIGTPLLDSPGWLTKEDHRHRIGFLLEELKEYELAVREGNLEHAFDALLDLAYVVLGTAVKHGFPWQAGWERVQAANMAKQPGATVRSPHDAIKPAGWEPPYLADLVNPHALSPEQHAYANRPQGCYDNCVNVCANAPGGCSNAGNFTPRPLELTEEEEPHDRD
jgi:predicted HAD superfamily Cof-like phosphohydrolase